MATTFLVTAQERREKGKTTIDLKIPRRVITYLRSVRPASVNMVFEKTGEAIGSIDSKALIEVLKKSRRKRK